MDLDPSFASSLEGVQSQYEYDFSQKNIWIKITSRNKITSNRTYLFDFPELPASSSLSFYEPTPAKEVTERRSGMLFPMEQRDFVYKSWMAVRVHLLKDSQQTFYARIYASESLDMPSISVIAQETIVNHDRLERMLLDMQALSMEDQKKQLGASFDEWKKGMEQIDDILVMGIRI